MATVLAFTPKPPAVVRPWCACGRRRTALTQCPECYRDGWRKQYAGQQAPEEMPAS